MSNTTKKPNPSWSLAVDYGPLLAFFLTYKFHGSDSGAVAQMGKIVTATAVFMVATVIALIVSKVRLGRISPMLWLSTILVVGFGGLTIWLHDPVFIQVKPTIIYVLLGGLLLTGVALKKPFLKYILEAGYDGLSDRGWMLMSRNWGVFFIAMALVNEVLRRALDFDGWLSVKLWALPALSILFAMSQIPLAMRHGLGEGDKDQAAD